MANNTLLNLGSGGDTLRDVDRAGIKTPVSLLDTGGSASELLVDATHGLTTNIIQVGGASFTLGQQVAAASIPIVLTAAQLTALAPISTVAVNNFPAGFLSAQAGSWNVGITGSVAVTGTFWQTTQPVSASALPLPTGASTEATLATLNGKVTACNTGAVVVSTLPATPAGTNLIGSTSAAFQTGQVYNGTTALTVKFAFTAVTTSGRTPIVPLVASKKIRVLSYAYQGDTAAAVYFASHTAGAISSTKPCLANQPLSKSESSLGHFETTAGEALEINVSVTQGVAGVDVVYVEV